MPASPFVSSFVSSSMQTLNGPVRQWFRLSTLTERHESVGIRAVLKLDFVKQYKLNLCEFKKICFGLVQHTRTHIHTCCFTAHSR